MTLRFTREELYRLVWSNPMSSIAKELGVSDVGLAKACKRADIPLPGLGHWAKVQHGHEMKRPALPPAPTGQSDIVTISPGQRRLRPDDLPEDIRELVAREATPETKVDVIKTLANPYPLVRSWLREAPKKQDQSTVVGSSDRQPVAKTERRRLRILSSLLSALEVRGHQILANRSDPRSVSLIIAGEKVEFSLTERLRQVKEELSERERLSPLNYGQTFRFVYKPTGELILKIQSLVGAGIRTGWRDRPEKPLEGELNRIIAGLLVASAVVRKQRLEREEAERRWQDMERQRLEAAEAQRRETQRRNELMSQVTRWRQAEEIRHYIKAVRSLLNNGSAGIGVESADEWASWASKVADEIDPLTHPEGRP
jgi:hypothetical protein